MLVRKNEECNMQHCCRYAGAVHGPEMADTLETVIIDRCKALTEPLCGTRSTFATTANCTGEHLHH